jgi:hypothetical protein
MPNDSTAWLRRLAVPIGTDRHGAGWKAGPVPTRQRGALGERRGDTPRAQAAECEVGRVVAVTPSTR